MAFPLGLLAALGRFGYNLYAHFFKGPKIAAVLIYQSKGKKELSDFNEKDPVLAEQDPLRQYEIFSNFILKLKNISPHTGYNIKLLNASEIFTSYERIEPLAHLEPGETRSLKVRFSYNAVIREQEADQAPAIPEELHNKLLDIVCQNAAGTNFFTCFKISDRSVDNAWFLKLPKR